MRDTARPMLGLPTTIDGVVVAHCRDGDGTTHLATMFASYLEEFATRANPTNPMPIFTGCNDYRTYDVYWVNTDTVPTCLRCVGLRDR